MEARCTGCGGRVMPYHQYITHFRPTATCMSCGRVVRFRFFARVMIVLGATGLIFYGFTRLVDSLALEITVGAALVLLGLLGDVWTYKKLTWDPVPQEGDAPGSHASA